MTRQFITKSRHITKRIDHCIVLHSTPHCTPMEDGRQLHGPPFAAFVGQRQLRGDHQESKRVQELSHQMDPLSNGRRVELARNKADPISGPYGVLLEQQRREFL
jgi:hypothetical protein